MIDRALEFLKAEANLYIKQKTGAGDKLVLSGIVEQSGDLNIDELGLSLVNIEEERANRPPVKFKETASGKLDKLNPDIRLYLYILFTANFGKANYKEALKFLSYVVQCFQAKNVFTPQNSPDLDAEISKLILELRTLSFEQQNHLWGTLGAKYMPSVMYKVTLLSIQEERSLESGKPIHVIAESLDN